MSARHTRGQHRSKPRPSNMWIYSLNSDAVSSSWAASVARGVSVSLDASCALAPAGSSPQPAGAFSDRIPKPADAPLKQPVTRRCAECGGFFTCYRASETTCAECAEGAAA